MWCTTRSGGTWGRHYTSKFQLAPAVSRPFPAPFALPNSSTFTIWQSTPIEGPRKDMPHTHIRLHSAYERIAEFKPPATLHALKNLIRCARCESPITEYERHHCFNTIVSTAAGEKEAIRHYQDNHADFEDGQASGFACTSCPAIFFSKADALRHCQIHPLTLPQLHDVVLPAGI
jgi:hypothetical protein